MLRAQRQKEKQISPEFRICYAHSSPYEARLLLSAVLPKDGAQDRPAFVHASADAYRHAAQVFSVHDGYAVHAGAHQVTSMI